MTSLVSPETTEARAGGAGASFQEVVRPINATTTRAPEQLENARRLLHAVLDHVDPESGRFVLCGFGEGQPRVWHDILDKAPFDGLEQARAWNEAGRNVHWGAGLVRHDLPPGERGGHDDLTCMLAIVVDVDEAEAARRVEREDFPFGLKPSALIRTSSTPYSRYQLVYFLQEPETDIAAWRRVARKLEEALGADHCSKDPSHVWRIPGTMNYPNKKKREQGRIDEPSILVYLDEDRRFSLDDFDDLPDVPEPCTSTAERRRTEEKTSREWAHPLDIVPTVYLRQEIESDEIKTQGENGADRSAADYRLCKELAKAGRTFGDALVLYRWGEANGKAFADKFAERGEDYLVPTWQNAVSEVPQHSNQNKSLRVRWS